MNRKFLIFATILLILIITAFIIFVRPGEIDYNEQGNESACLALGCPEGTEYVGSENSDKFYRCECGWAKLIHKENLICFESEQKALDRDYIKTEC